MNLSKMVNINYSKVSKTKMNSLIQQVKNKYEILLKSQEQGNVQLEPINELRQLCNDALQFMNQNPQYNKNKKDIQTILLVCSQAQNKKFSNQQKSQSSDSGFGFINGTLSNQILVKQGKQKIKLMSQVQKQKLAKVSHKLSRKIIEKQIKSKDLIVSDQRLDQLADQFSRIHYVQENILELVVQQNSSIEQVAENLNQNLENVKTANTQLKEAHKLQNLAFIKKIKLGVTGFLGTIGLAIFGIPGMIFGLIEEFLLQNEINKITQTAIGIQEIVKHKKYVHELIVSSVHKIIFNDLNLRILFQKFSDINNQLCLYKIFTIFFKSPLHYCLIMSKKASQI